MLPRQEIYARALRALHVGSIPESLSCRHEQYREIDAALTGMLDDDSGGCIYISGVPGTGKTASVQTLMKNVQNRPQSTGKIRYLEINGLKLTDPNFAYVLLLDALSNTQNSTVTGDARSKQTPRRFSPQEALNQLTQHFENPNRNRESPLVVLIDELDQLMTPRQDVIYNFFDWPSFPKSRLLVIAIANTHDMPERVMLARVRSRLGMIRFNFAPYKSENLQDIVKERLKSAEVPNLFADDAIRLAAMRVANISGDARRMLDICRRAVEVAMAADTARVTTAQMNTVINAMQMTTTTTYLRQCSLQERVMLASLLYCIRRSGVSAISWAEVREQHYLWAERLAHPDGPSQWPRTSQLRLVLNSLRASRVVLLEDEACLRKISDEERRVIINLEPGEVRRTLAEIGGETWRAVLGL